MIRWNWQPKKLVFVDFETQSTVDLVKEGSQVYAKNRSTRLLSAVFKLPGKKPLVWVPEPPKGLKYKGLAKGTVVPPPIVDLAKSCTWVAHNAEGFDALVWEALYPDIIPQWLDTLPLCKAAGLPGSIDALGELLGYGGKDKKAVDALRLLSRFKDKTRPVGTLPLWTLVLDYNVKDVNVLEAVYQKTLHVLKPHAARLTLHSKINERGFKVDKRLAVAVGKLWRECKDDAGDDVYRLTDGKLSSLMLRSTQAVHSWLRSQGVFLDTLKRDEVNSVLADPEQLGEVEDEALALVIEVLKQRSIATRTADAKIDRLVNSVDSDSVLRYAFTYHAAATGRWGSREVQIHNLTKGEPELLIEELLATKLTMKDIERAVKSTNKRLAKKGRPLTSPAEVLNTLTRPLIVATRGTKLGIIDFGAIEARCLAWMAGEKNLLKLFSDPNLDVYCDMASGLFGRPITKDDKAERHIGKQIVLGCGYSMGAVRFESYCKLSRIDLKSVGLTGKLCVEAYRSRYPAIPKLWKAVQAAAMKAIRGKPSEAGRCHFEHIDGDLVVTLPSGRKLYYREAQIAKRVPAWARMMRKPVAPQDCIVYAHPFGERTLYGGLITENLDQAISNDVLADAMLALDAKGYDIRLHVHDEAVFEGGDLVEAARIMSTPPTWAKDFPVTVEGFDCPRYSKTPFKGSKHVRAINGQVY